MDSKAVATVSYVNIVISVSVVYGSAYSANTVTSVSTPQYVIPSASVSAVYILLDYAIDPIGRNPVLRDIIIKTDTVVKSVGKNPSDIFILSEGPGLESAYALNYFLQDYTVESGIPVLLFNKALSDSPPTSDLKTFTLSRLVADTYTKSDSVAKSFSKGGIADSQAKSDSQVISFGKNPADTIANSDVITSRVFSKALLDTPAKSDSVAKSFSRPLTDSFGKADVTFNLVGKNVSDSQSMSDIKSFFVQKALLDNVQSTDDFLGEANSDDDQVMAFSKAISDTYSKSDNTVLLTHKVFSDSTSKSDGGYLAMTDYWDIGYTDTATSVYVGTYLTF